MLDSWSAMKRMSSRVSQCINRYIQQPNGTFTCNQHCLDELAMDDFDNLIPDLN